VTNDSLESFQPREVCEKRLKAHAAKTPLVPVNWKNWTTAEDINNPIQSAFIQIYETNSWGGGLGSGPGSALTFTTHIRCYMHNLILAFNIQTIIDAPCGDLWWMSYFLSEHPNLNYIGVDIVPAVINHHKDVHSRHNREFYVGDLTNTQMFSNIKANSKVWKGNTMIMTRHAIEHNKAADQIVILKNIHDSKANYFFGTSHVDTHVQQFTDKSGGFSAANFRLAPYNLPPPIEYMYEQSKEVYMGFWTLPFSQWKPQ